MTPLIKKRLGALGICVAMAISIGSMVWWNAKTSPVLVGRPHPVLAHVLAVQQYPDAFDPLWHIPKHPPQFRLAHYLIEQFGRKYEIILSSQLLFFLLLIAASWRIGSKLGGPVAGKLTALLAAFTPVYMMGALVFDDHMLNMALVALGVAFMVEGKGWRRIIFGVPAGLCFGLALRYSFIFSTGLIAAGCGIFALFGNALDGRMGPRDEESDARKLWRLRLESIFPIVAGAILLFTAMIFALYRDGTLLSIPVNYYLAEVSKDSTSSVWADPLGLWTYPYLIFRHQLGPFMSLAVLFGVFSLIRNKASGRFSLIFWLFGPLMILSIITKKNYYYDYYALVAASPLAGVGIASYSNRRGWSAAAGLSVFAIAAYSLLRLISYSPAPESPMMNYLQSRPRIFLQQPMQSSFVRQDDIETTSSLIQDVAEPHLQAWIVMTGEVALDIQEEWRYGILMQNPKVRFDVARDASFYAPITVNTFFLQAKDGDGIGKPARSLNLGELIQSENVLPSDVSTSGNAKNVDDFKKMLTIIYESAYWVLYRPGD